MQQWLHYLAILADHLANSQGILAKEVIGLLNLLDPFINQLVVFLFQKDVSERDGGLPQTSRDV